MSRIALIVGLLLMATLSSSAQFVGGMSGIGGRIGGAGGNAGGGGGACAGVLDLSTGCAQLVAFGGLF